MSSVQNDIWTLLTVLAVGVVPIGVVLFMLRRSRRSEPPGGAVAASECRRDSEGTQYEIPGDGPLSWRQRIAYELGVIAGVFFFSLLVTQALKLYIFMYKKL